MAKESVQRTPIVGQVCSSSPD